MPISEPVIDGAVVSAGHDGQAELVVRLRFPNGATDRVTLNAEHGERLLVACQVATIEELAGQSWRRVLNVLEGDEGAKDA